VKKQRGRDCAEARGQRHHLQLLAPDDPKAVAKPSGLRLGVQEMTHWA
jgi:glycine/serine hydroxymethyltransferase